MINSHIQFTAFGAYCDEFIDYLVNSRLQVWDITCKHGIFTVKTSYNNYPMIARKAKEFRAKTKVVSRKGVYFLLRRYRKRIGIPVGLIAFFGIIVLMSNFVWSIRITGNHQIGRWQIIEQLSSSGIKPGVHIESFNANHAELEMSLALEELAWVSIERTGSRINVKISERVDDNDSGLIAVNVPCNVIANRSGQLIRAEVYRGELLYEIGSGVNAGDVVVGGIVGGSPVHADALLLIEAVEIVDFYQPYTVFHRAKNGRSVSNRSVVFLGLRFGGEIGINPHSDHVQYYETLTAPNLFGFPLPVRILNQDYIFYDRVEVTDPPVTGLEKLNKQIQMYELNFLKEAQIIEKQVEYFPDDKGIGGLVRYVFHIDAAQKQELMTIDD